MMTFRDKTVAVSYTHLTLPTILRVVVIVLAVFLIEITKYANEQSC